MSENDDVHRFIMQCYKICQEAQFVIDALPAVETERVEGSVRQLEAIWAMLANIEDPYLEGDTGDDMMEYVATLAFRLNDHLEHPPPHPNTGIPRIRTGRPGQPAYNLDLQRALLLHDLGNSWEDVAGAMGVTSRTIYNHLERHGLSPARKEWTKISEDDLDEIVAKFSLEHPYSGCSVVMGHLESQGIHLPRLRIQQSLKRVDEIGVLTRSVLSLNTLILY